MEKNNIFDLIIIGAGPAGLAASIYASRYGLKHLMIGEILGGQISETHLIDNYPGLEDLSGLDFSQKWGKHARKYGVEIISQKVKNTQKTGRIVEVILEDNKIFKTRALLLATGTKRRKLNLPGEAGLIGKGVSYCATCDGFFYKGKTVGVVGGSDSAAGAALYLANICQKVCIIYRKSALRAEPFWVKEIEKTKNIELVYDTNISEIIGQNKLEKVRLDKEYQNSKELVLDGLFIEAGSDPDLGYAKDLGIEMDEGGYVKIKKDSATNVPGVFAAGDLTDGSDKFRQVITAAAEGAIAARAIFNWLKK